MTVEEFSDQFDVLLNSYAIVDKFGKPAPSGSIELDEYEKSVFLTRAQEQLIIDLYTGREQLLGPFESTEEVRRLLDSLISTCTIDQKVVGPTQIIPSSIIYRIPTNFLFIVYESVRLDDPRAGCENGNDISIVPISHDEFYKTYRNPFKGPNKKRALRLNVGKDMVEIISSYNIKSYFVRGIVKPNPIILSNLPTHLKINGQGEVSECMLHESIQKLILDRAVRDAIVSRSYNIVNK